MRSSRPVLPVIAFAFLVLGCSDQTPVAPTEAPQLSTSLSTAPPTAAEIKAEIDAVFVGAARLGARTQFSSIELDIRARRFALLYLKAIGLAGYSLYHLKHGGISPDKLDRLLPLLCAIQRFVYPHLPPAIPRIDFCKVDPGLVGADAKAEIIRIDDDQPDVVQSGTLRSAMYFPAGSVEASGGSFALVLAIPLKRLLVPKQCPAGTSPSLAAYDCYPETYDWSMTPVLRVTGAVMAVCHEPPGASEFAPPNQTVYGRLTLVEINPNQSVVFHEPTAPVLVNGEPIANCDTEPHPDVIGAGGWRSGVYALQRLGKRAVGFFAPKPLYALNLPTHIEFDGLLDGDEFFGIDPVIRAASVDVTPASATVAVGARQPFSAVAYDKSGGEMVEPAFTWSSSSDAVATADESGVAVGVAPGDVTITATTYGASGSASLSVTRSVLPAGGGEIVVFTDINPFAEGFITTNNVLMVRNLVNFANAGSRGSSGSVVWFDFDQSGLCADGSTNACASPSWFSTMEGAITGDGYDVEYVKSSSTSFPLASIPANVKVIFLFLPVDFFTTAEVNSLKSFAAEGGRVVFVADYVPIYGGVEAQNDLLARLGVDMRNIGGLFGAGSTTIPASGIWEHQITQGMTSFTLAGASQLAFATPSVSSPLFILTEGAFSRQVGAWAPINTTPIVP